MGGRKPKADETPEFAGPAFGKSYSTRIGVFALLVVRESGACKNRRPLNRGLSNLTGVTAL